MRSPEEVKRDLVRQWLTKAEEDFGLAEQLLEEDSPYLNAIGFHAQQAAEKYLKAILVWHQIDFPKTHNLGELLDLVKKADSPLADSLRGATALNPYGVEIRYPGDLPEMTPAEAKQAGNWARQVRTVILSFFKGRLEFGK